MYNKVKVNLILILLLTVSSSLLLFVNGVYQNHFTKTVQYSTVISTGTNQDFYRHLGSTRTTNATGANRAGNKTLRRQRKKTNWQREQRLRAHGGRYRNLEYLEDKLRRQVDPRRYQRITYRSTNFTGRIQPIYRHLPGTGGALGGYIYDD